MRGSDELDIEVNMPMETIAARARQSMYHKTAESGIIVIKDGVDDASNDGVGQVNRSQEVVALKHYLDSARIEWAFFEGNWAKDLPSSNQKMLNCAE